MQSIKTRLELIKDFYDAPAETLFSQETYCAVLNCSTATAERKRWVGVGVPFIKDGRRVLYRKSDILKYLENCHVYQSTTEAQEKLGESR